MNAPAFWEIFVTYRKVGRLRYLSHLDVARGMERALRRSGLPIRYTKGYNRRMRLHFGQALPVGAEGKAEILGIEMTQPLPPEEIARRMNEQLPPELAVTRAWGLPQGAASPFKALERANYTMVVAASPPVAREDLTEAVTVLLAAKEFLLLCSEGEGKVVDIRPRIYDLAVGGDGDHLELHMTLGHSQDNYLNPDRCLRALEVLMDRSVSLRWTRLVRTALLSRPGERLQCAWGVGRGRCRG